MRKYAITEIFSSFQGEGSNTGKSAVFVRFSGCNLWTGKLSDRVTNNTCGRWCDTDFNLRYKLSLEEIIENIHVLGPAQLIVLTGGEPLLHIDQYFVDMLNTTFSSLVCIETNGTIAKELKDCWITVSPKENTLLKITNCSELKLVYPQQINIENILKLVTAETYFLQPKNNLESLEECIPILQQYPTFKLSLQIHKFLGVR